MPAAGLIAGAVGFLVGLPALRMHGIYLAIATLAVAEIFQHIFIRWESVTGGFRGLPVPKAEIAGFRFDDEVSFYFLCLVVLAAMMLGALNILRSPTGRAWVAIRDSEIAAQSMGVNLAYYKTRSFAISAAVTGLAGALYAHQIKFLGPDQFTLMTSIEFLMMVVIGGMGSLHGAVLGAVSPFVSPSM